MGPACRNSGVRLCASPEDTRAACPTRRAEWRNGRRGGLKSRCPRGVGVQVPPRLLKKSKPRDESSSPAVVEPHPFRGRLTGRTPGSEPVDVGSTPTPGTRALMVQRTACDPPKVEVQV